MDAHDPVAIESGNIALSRIKDVRNGKALGMTIVEDGIDEARVVTRSLAIP
jgi:hypothetical protein